MSDQTSREQQAEILQRITNYLELGGLFNPEMMEPSKVRELLIDIRSALRAPVRPQENEDQDQARYAPASAQQSIAAQRDGDRDVCVTCGSPHPGQRIMTDGKVWWHDYCDRPAAIPDIAGTEPRPRQDGYHSMSVDQARGNLEASILEHSRVAEHMGAFTCVPLLLSRLIYALIDAVRSEDGYHGTQPLSEASGSAQSEAQEKQSLNVAPPASSPETPE